MGVMISTTISQELWNLAKEKHLKWNECLIIGIKKLANEPYKEEKGTKIEEESEKSKRIRVQTAMQGTIDHLNDEIEKLNEIIKEKDVFQKQKETK